MEVWITPTVAIIAAILASTGFWAYLQTRYHAQRSTDKLIMGLAYDKITTLGMSYIERGWISKDEFEDFRKYLFEPYQELGGNGVAERIMTEVARLPLLRQDAYTERIKKKRTITTDPKEVTDQ